MQKYKLWQTVDCVVGGIYYKRGTQAVEYLLMGLYDDEGRLNYVGRCGVRENGPEIAKLLKPSSAASASLGICRAGKAAGQAVNASPCRCNRDNRDWLPR